MNRDKFFDMFNGTSDEFVADAIESRKVIRPMIRKNRVMLIAAAIAVAMVLVGCAAVYFWLQDLSIGTKTYTQYYDDEGRALETPIEGKMELFAFVGYSDSDANKAAAEWFQFTQSYDPEGKLSNNIPDQPEIPNHYEWTYSCYTQEMVDKLDEIAAKYNMKLLEEWVPVQRWQSEIALKEGLGVTTLLKPNAKATMTEVQGMLYPPYNFDLGFDLQLTGEDAVWSDRVWIDAYYFHKDYLPAHGVWSADLEKTDQWNYTTSDGVTLLLAMDNKGRSFITCQRDDAFQVVSVSGNNSGSKYPSADQIPDKKAVEQIAEAFDFCIDFTDIDAQAMKPAMDAAEEAHRAEQTYVPEVYDGYEDYLRKQCVWFYDTVQYVYHDLNGDGEEELLLASDEDGKTFLWRQLTMKDGQIVEQWWDQYLYEDNVTMNYIEGYHSSYERWEFWKRAFTGVENDGQFLGCVIHNADGSWQIANEANYQYDDAPIATQAEAEAFLAQFIPMDLDWKPMSDYPLSDGTTIGDYLESLDVPLSQNELRQLYIETFAEEDNEFRTHYRLMDINGDDMEEILISGDGKTYWEIFSYRNGQVQNLGLHSFSLCENGVFEKINIHHELNGVEIQEYEYYTFDGWKAVSLNYVAYNKSTASWQTDLDGTTIPEAEAQAILAKYRRIDQGMKPISELINE